MQLTVQNVNKTFSDFVAVRDFDLAVQAGEFIALLGPSGCGKTTMLRLIAGLETVSSGQIFVGERDVTYAEPQHRNLAMVFQNYALYPHLSVFENMAMGLRYRKLSKPEIQGRVDEAVRMLRLEGLLERKPRALSGGQRQRVALARAVVREPAILLMDEPLSNLDAQLRVATRAELVRLHARLGSTILYVTHDQSEAMTMSSRVVVMNGGEIQQVGTPQEIYGRPGNTFVASFIGSPPMRLLDGVCAGGTFSAGEARLGPLEGFSHITGPVKLGVRPEDVYLSVPSGKPTRALPATVQWVEVDGPDSYVHLDWHGHTLIARTSTLSELPRVGAQVTAYVDLSRRELFDAVTGQRHAPLRTPVSVSSGGVVSGGA